jgi:hypothetical protein
VGVLVSEFVHMRGLESAPPWRPPFLAGNGGETCWNWDCVGACACRRRGLAGELPRVKSDVKIQHSVGMSGNEPRLRPRLQPASSLTVAAR